MAAQFPEHTSETISKDTKELFQVVEKQYGFIPNLYRSMATSDVLPKSYAYLNDMFNKSAFDATGYLVVTMTASRINGCTYCMAAHTVASEWFEVDKSVIEDLRNGAALSDPKLEALRVFTLKMIDSAGAVRNHELEAFLSAGWTPTHALDVVVGLALKTLSNFSNNLSNPSLDQQFAKGIWEEA